VVTRDRLVLLRECLTAVSGQTLPVDAVIVVDNASGDDTRTVVRQEFPEVRLIALKRNEGGAGGFHAGMRAAYEQGVDWIWLMDDDTVPEPDALEALVAPLDDLGDLPEPALLASQVLWIDGTLHPKNLPWIRLEGDHLPDFLAAVSRRLIPLRTASFVSILVSRRAVSVHGLPHRHYFIWGDDGEYTARLLKEATGYLVPASVVRHKTRHRDPVHADRAAIDQYYYEVRNKLFMIRSSSWTRREKGRLATATVLGSWLWLRGCRFRPRALIVLIRAVHDGLRRVAE